MRKALLTAAFGFLIASCMDGGDSAAGRHRIDALDQWVSEGASDSISAAVSANVTVLRPGAAAETGDNAIAMIRSDATAALRTRTGLQDFPGAVVEYGEIRISNLTTLHFTRSWAIEESEWRLVVDAVTATASATEASAPPATDSRFRGSRGEPVERPSVEEFLVLLAERDPLALQAARAAAERCANPDPWHRDVMARIVATEPSSYDGGFLVRLARAVAPAGPVGSDQCSPGAVQAWLRRAIRVPLTPRLYEELLPSVDFTDARDMASNTTFPVELRVVATEAVVYDQGGSIGGHPRYLESHFSSWGLLDAYVYKWIPLLLALPETREATATFLMAAVANRPENEGAPALITIIGSQVAAFPERFSPEAAQAVTDAFAELSRRDDLAPAVQEALDRTARNRAEGRNYHGVVVQDRPWYAEWILGEESCSASLPEAFEMAIRRVVPGIELVVSQPYSSHCSGMRAIGDFDGDGADDLVVQGTDAGNRVIVAVMNRANPEAHLLTRPGSGQVSIWTTPPDVKSPGCNDQLPLRDPFLEPSVVVSYDDKYAERYRWAQGAFELVEGSGC